MRRQGLGELEHLVLLAILRLGENAYGVSIVDEIERRTGRPLTQASAYLTLRRLQKKGLVSTRRGEPTPQRGGRAKRFFSLQPEALLRLSRTRSALRNMWEGHAGHLDQILPDGLPLECE